MKAVARKMRPIGNSLDQSSNSEPLLRLNSSTDQSNDKIQPMDRFRRYEEEFLNSTRIINQGLIQLQRLQGNNESILSISIEIEGELSECEGYLRAMEVEFNSLSTSDKRLWSQKLAEYKEEYRQYVNECKISRTEADKNALKSNTVGTSKLISLNQRLDNTTQNLEESRKIIANTEDIGSNILVNLEKQKETLKSSSEYVTNTGEIAEDAKLVLKQIRNRDYWRNMLLIFIIFILAILIFVVIYYGFIHRWK